MGPGSGGGGAGTTWSDSLSLTQHSSKYTHNTQLNGESPLHSAPQAPVKHLILPRPLLVSPVSAWTLLLSSLVSAAAAGGRRVGAVTSGRQWEHWLLIGLLDTWTLLDTAGHQTPDTRHSVSCELDPWSGKLNTPACSTLFIGGHN